MSEDEIIGTFEHWIEYEKANKDKINKADELIEIQQGLLDLYQKEKEKNKELYKDNQKQWGERCRLAIELDNNTISKDKIKAKIEEYEQLSERNKDGKHWTDEAILYDRQAEALRELLED